MLEMLPLTQYSWCHLQHCGKIMAAAFCFRAVAVWPKETVTLQKSSLWRAKCVLAVHLLRVLWGCFRTVSLYTLKGWKSVAETTGKRWKSSGARGKPVEGKANQELWDARAALVQCPAEEGYIHLASLLFFSTFMLLPFLKPNHWP